MPFVVLVRASERGLFVEFSGALGAEFVKREKNTFQHTSTSLWRVR